MVVDSWMLLTVGCRFFVGVGLLVGALALSVVVVCLLLVPRWPLLVGCWLVLRRNGRWWLVVVGSRYFLGLVADSWSPSVVG